MIDGNAKETAMSQDTASIAKSIRAAYKAEGWNAKAISVRISRYSMGSSITVEVKDASVVTDLEKAKAIAEGGEDIRRDGFGDILSGGNRYVHFNISPEAKAQLAAPVLDATKAALAELETASENALVKVEGTEVLLGRGLGHKMAQVWANGRAGMNVDTCYPESVAFRVAVAS